MIIYALMDPRTSCLRYVGKTAVLVNRDSQHSSAQPARDRSHRANWIRALLKLGLKPTLEVLEEVEGDGSDAERFWIASLRAAGANLVNTSDGGETSPMLRRDVARKVGDALRGRPRNPTAIKATADWHRGRKRSQETIAKLRIAMSGNTNGRGNLR